jgi:TolB-like protein/Tfp pilus assembly protein PilF
VADDLVQDRLWQPLLHELGEIEMKHGVKVGIVNLYTEELGNRRVPEKLSRGTDAAVKQPPVSSTIAPDIPEKSIAVLPFENLSAEQENAFFTDGVQDEILTNLAKIADLKVISRTSVLQYKTGIKRNLREIANALGVAHVVEGTVQRAGNRVRVSAQLIDARSDTHLWGEHYHRPLDDVFAIQSEIAKAVADELKAKLSPSERVAIEQKPTSDLAAYDRYIRAKALLAGTLIDARVGDNFSQAVRLLSQAIARDPNFFLAYCQLVWAHAQLYFFGFDHTAARLALANQALERAMRLGPDRGEAHLAAAWIYYQGYLDYDRARAELDVARLILPNETFVFALAGYIDRRQGRWQEHISNLERALEIDPRNVQTLTGLSGSYKFLRRFKEMGDVLDRTLAIIPTDAMTRVARAFVDLDVSADTAPLRATIHDVVTEDPNAGEAIADHWFHFALCERDPAEVTRALAFISPEGDTLSNVRMPRTVFEAIAARARGDAVTARTAFTAARAEMEKTVIEQPDYAEALCMLGLIDAGVGRKEEALTEGRRAVELLPVTKDALTGAELMMFLAIIYAWTGEMDLALKELTSLLEIPGFHLSYGHLRLHPYWDPLRGDPRFEKLVEESKKPVALK